MSKPLRRTFLPLLAALPLVLVACGVSSQQIEENIKTKFKSEGIELKSVKCPDAKGEPGTKFDCKAEDADGTSFVVHVTTTKEGIEWKLDGVIVETAKLSAFASATAGSEVECAAKFAVAFEGRKIKCKKKGGSGELTFVFDKDGTAKIEDAGSTADEAAPAVSAEEPTKAD